MTEGGQIGAFWISVTESAHAKKGERKNLPWPRAGINACLPSGGENWLMKRPRAGVEGGGRSLATRKATAYNGALVFPSA